MFGVNITSNILPNFEIMGLHQPVCQMNKNLTRQHTVPDVKFGYRWWQMY